MVKFHIEIKKILVVLLIFLVSINCRIQGVNAEYMYLQQNFAENHYRRYEQAYPRIGQYMPVYIYSISNSSLPHSLTYRILQLYVNNYTIWHPHYRINLFNVSRDNGELLYLNLFDSYNENATQLINSEMAWWYDNLPSDAHITRSVYQYYSWSGLESEFDFMLGGLSVYAYGPGRYKLFSNLTIYEYSSPDGFVAINDVSIMPIFDRYLNISENLYLDPNSLDASVWNGTQFVTIQNPMFINNSAFRSVVPGYYFITIAGRQYELVDKDDTRLEFFNAAENITLWYKTTGQLWKMRWGRTYDYVDPAPYGAEYCTTWDIIDFWFDWPYHPLYNSGYLEEDNTLTIVLISVGAGAAAVATLIIIIKKKKNS